MSTEQISEWNAREASELQRVSSLDIRAGNPNDKLLPTERVNHEHAMPNSTVLSSPAGFFCVVCRKAFSDALNPETVDSTAADPKPKDLDQTEATAQFFDDLVKDHQEYWDECANERAWSLRDEGRSDGYGDSESYAERNL